MRKSSFTLDAATLVVGATLATPAAAWTESGSINCSAGGSRIAVQAQQQRSFDQLVGRVNGYKLFEKTGVFVWSGVSGALSGSWSGSSVSLLAAGTKGYCKPNA